MQKVTSSWFFLSTLYILYSYCRGCTFVIVTAILTCQLCVNLYERESRAWETDNELFTGFYSVLICCILSCFRIFLELLPSCLLKIFQERTPSSPWAYLLWLTRKRYGCMQLWEHIFRTNVDQFERTELDVSETVSVLLA